MRYFRAVTAVVTVAVLVFAPDTVSWATEVQVLPENNHVTTESRPVNTDPHAEVPAEGDEGMGGLEPSIDVNSPPVSPDAAVPSEGDLSLNADVTLEVEAIEDPAELKQMESEIMQKQEEQWQGEVAEANQPIPDCDKNNRFVTCTAFFVRETGSCANCNAGKPITWVRGMVFRFDHHMAEDSKEVNTTAYVLYDGDDRRPGYNLPDDSEVFTYQLVTEVGDKLLEPEHIRASDLVRRKGYVTLGVYKPDVKFIEPETPPDRLALLFKSNMDSASMVRVVSGAYIRCSGAWPYSRRNCVNPLVPAVYKVSLKEFPAVAGHIKYAIEEKGKPSNLTKQYTRDNTNRDIACSRTNQNQLAIDEPAPDNMTNPSCDEYPFNSAMEGGTGASIRWVENSENTKQGADLNRFYRYQQVQRGDKFTVEVVP